MVFIEVFCTLCMHRQCRGRPHGEHKLFRMCFCCPSANLRASEQTMAVNPRGIMVSGQGLECSSLGFTRYGQEDRESQAHRIICKSHKYARSPDFVNAVLEFFY